ncbi:FAD-dependent monooxygenase [Rhodococcus sp. NPDC058521]|uniref:FAD-dependent monooxygenase n=1 Tax=Rhodococcus sp. NPDC058521 TaxID=3346536 RepID=UPI00365A6F84
MSNPEVLVVGSGPVGLTAAIELCRRGVSCRIVDALDAPPQYAKAVGVQPRTLEVFEGMGVLGRFLDAIVPMLGQIVYVNGSEVARFDLELPDEIPFGFVGLPQYATERILTEHLAELGTFVERGVRLTSFAENDDGVEATLEGGRGTESVRAQYLMGCDGAHSVVRKKLGLTFEGAAFTEQYMLGDVAVDWNQPHGYAIRSMHVTDGQTDDVLVCIPLPGRGRYRMSMLVPDELSTEGVGSADGVEHGFEGERVPQLHHIQAVLDQLSPEPTTASNMRWSSVFKISHRIVDSYGLGRVFVAGDAAHIHPPTGAQGMNTGIQDAHNLAWKIALSIAGDASPSLLGTYDAERRPVGEDVVGRTVRSAREGIGAGESDPRQTMLRQAQLLIDYSQSPIVAGEAHPVGPGSRAPDARGLTREGVAFSLRLFSLLDRLGHTLLVYARASVDLDAIDRVEKLAATARGLAHGRLSVYLVVAPETDVVSTVLPVVRDTDGEFAAGYGATEQSTYVVRPDGYLGFRCGKPDGDALAEYLKATFR